jgi:opacity protein-like surface antigen
MEHTMQLRTSLCAGACAVTTCLACPGAGAQTGSTPEATEAPPGEPSVAPTDSRIAGRRELGEDLYVDIQAYAWVPFSVQGDSTVRGLTVDLDLSPNEVFDLFNGAVSARGELWSDDWGAFADFQFVKLGQEKDAFKIEIENAVFDFGAAYRALRTPVGDDPGATSLVLDFYGGGRLQYLDQEITAGPLKPSGSATWVSPLLGTRLIASLSDDWTVLLRADVGGFGVNADKDLNWSVLAGARWQFAERWDMRFGYRFFGSKYLEDEGTPGAFGQDLVLHGPYLGVAVTF